MRTYTLIMLIIVCAVMLAAASTLYAQDALRMTVSRAERFDSVGIAVPLGLSPRGRYAAFAWDGPADSQTNIRIVDMMGTSFPVDWARNPCFLPTDTGVLYWRALPADLGLCRMSLPSASASCMFPSTITNGGIGFIGYGMDLNSNATEVATGRLLANGFTGIAKMRLSDGWFTQLVGFGENPIWSPNDRMIAFMAPGADGSMVWVVGANGANLNPVYPGALIGWTADSRSLLVLDYDGMTVLRADATGRTNNVVGVFPDVTVISGAPEVSISKTGKYLLGVTGGQPVAMNLLNGNVFTFGVTGVFSPFWGRNDYEAYYRTEQGWFVARIAPGQNLP